jgi:hypothetical protein
VRIPVPQSRDNGRATPERRKSGATQRAKCLWAVRLRCSFLIPPPRDGHTSWLAPSTHRKPLLRGAAGHFDRLLDLRAWGVASPLRLNVDFVVNTAFVVKTLQVRQQGRLRELHRLWCWPQRSSHGRDQLGYRSCTLTRGPAPKSTQPCFMSQPSSSYVFLRKPRGEVLKKNK